MTGGARLRAPEDRPGSGQAAVRLGEAHTLGAAVAAMTRLFREAGLESPGLDARRLATWALRIGDMALVRAPERPISADERQALAEAVGRRLAREPVSRITGQRAFHGLELEIGPATLDPRPDTETLVEAALELFAEGAVPGSRAPRLADLGTGSGAILIALLHRLPAARGLGVDIEPEALAVAARNALRHGVERRCRFQQTSWLDGVDDRFALIAANPPYIPSAEIAHLAPEVAWHDPARALDGGADGLDAYRAIAAAAGRALEPGGWILFEVGDGQGGAVASILAQTPAFAPAPGIRRWRDLGGRERCVAAQARP